MLQHLFVTRSPCIDIREAVAGWCRKAVCVMAVSCMHLSYRMGTRECSVKDGDYREGRQLLPGLSCDAPIHLFGTQ